VSIQIGEQLERRQGRVRALASVSDRSCEVAVEPGSADRADSTGGAPSLGCCAEFFVECVRPHFRVARSDGTRALVKQGSTAESVTSPANLVRTRPALAGSVDPPSGLHQR
jgi:hypothetical protein